MKALRTRALAALAMTVGLAAFVNLPSDGPRAAPSALSVSMYCEYGYCEATASGGSGNYTWAWENANPDNTTGTISSATPCWTYNGQTVTVKATANDGYSTASASRRYVCSY
ncbi:hypothetical protein [Longimicrobium sp.]|jgi:hypothetical protein|uniref:hypothetical protein n=1 Tax=Longimicrobium sp. TaxID=2029185 RepID=UPI002F944299